MDCYPADPNYLPSNWEEIADAIGEKHSLNMKQLQGAKSILFTPTRIDAIIGSPGICRTHIIAAAGDICISLDLKVVVDMILNKIFKKDSYPKEGHRMLRPSRVIFEGLRLEDHSKV